MGDKFCDGLGACLGHCPKDAIRIVEREADGFDQEATSGHQRKAELLEDRGSCPGSQILHQISSYTTSIDPTLCSQLNHWPIQLHLVPAETPFFQGADLLLAASCVAFAHAGFHAEILSGRSLIIACPKLDRTEPYLGKLTEILRRNDVRSLTVAVMEVPCCQGLMHLARRALQDSGKRMPITVEVITIKGNRK
jgi:ferredoxin